MAADFHLRGDGIPTSNSRGCSLFIRVGVIPSINGSEKAHIFLIHALGNRNQKKQKK
jgi:hypothetical protein